MIIAETSKGVNLGNKVFPISKNFKISKLLEAMFEISYYF